MKYYLFLLLFLLSNNLFCQDNFQELDFLFPGDSIPSNTFMLDEVTVYQPLTFENDDEILSVFNEIVNEIKKINLRDKIEFLEEKVSLNLDEKLYSELLSLRNQLKSG